MSDKIVFKTCNVLKALEDTREIVAIASSQESDQDHDIIYLDKTENGEGMNLKEFKKNPVILWAHDAFSPPIAKATQIKKQDGKLKLKIQFPDPEVSSFSDTVYKLVKSGFLNSLSVGFRPNWEKAKFNEKRKGYDFYEGTLFETSIVPIGANSNATIISRSLDAAVTKGIIDDLERKDFLLNIKTKMEDSKDGQKEIERKEAKTEGKLTSEEVITEKSVEQITIKELHDMVLKLQTEFSIISKKLELKENPIVEERVHPVDKIINDFLVSSEKSVDTAKSLDDLVDNILKK